MITLRFISLYVIAKYYLNKDNPYPFGYGSLDNKYAPLHVNMQDALLLPNICYTDVIFINLCLARYHSNSANCYFDLNYFVINVVLTNRKNVPFFAVGLLIHKYNDIHYPLHFLLIHIF